MAYERLTVKRSGRNYIKTPVDGMHDCPFISHRDGEYEYTTGKAVDRLAELEDKIENKKLVFIPEYSEKYAIIKYTFRKNQPFDIAIYYPCGIRMNGEVEYGFFGLKSGNIIVVQNGFATKEAAEARLKELKSK